MLSWLPLIGPILQGLFSTASSIYATFKSTQVEQIKADVATAQVSAQIIHDTNDDICLRLLRDTAVLGPVVWAALISWDTIVALRWPWLKFNVSDYPKDVGYIPYAALAFLFGNIGFNIWKRK